MRANSPGLPERRAGVPARAVALYHREVTDVPAKRVPGDRLAPLYDLAAEAGIERSTAWRWLRDGELGQPVKIPGDRRVHVERAAFLRALQAPRRRRRQRGGDSEVGR